MLYEVITEASEAYDPKSLEHILAGTYPVEEDMIKEMEAFNEVFQKYEVQVFRPEIIENYNQIFTRDIGFVIDDFFIKANILPDRERELDARITSYNVCYTKLLRKFISGFQVLNPDLVICTLDSKTTINMA